MKYYKFIFTIFLIFNVLIVVSQDKTPEVILQARESIFETKVDKIAKKDLEIYYKGQSFTFGDSFEEADRKIGKEAVYSGEFNLKLEGVGFYNGKADYMIRFKEDDFYFRNGRLAFFEIRSKDFSVKLHSNEGSNGVAHLKVGQSVNVIKKLFRKSFDEKTTVGDSDHDTFIINVGELQADSPIANDLLIKVGKGTDKIRFMAFYGY